MLVLSEDGSARVTFRVEERELTAGRAVTLGMRGNVLDGHRNWDGVGVVLGGKSGESIFSSRIYAELEENMLEGVDQGSCWRKGQSRRTGGLPRCW